MSLARGTRDGKVRTRLSPLAGPAAEGASENTPLAGRPTGASPTVRLSALACTVAGLHSIFVYFIKKS